MRERKKIGICWR